MKADARTPTEFPPARGVARRELRSCRDPAVSQAGLSLVELLAVVAIVGIALGLSAVYLTPFEAPLEAGCDLFEGLTKQVRARSIATTTAHRIRPLDSENLTVESATRCDATDWTLEERMELELPDEVTLSDTTWTVCFNSRGIASQNFIVQLNHPERGYQQLEVLLGGGVRRLGGSP